MNPYTHTLFHLKLRHTVGFLCTGILLAAVVSGCNSTTALQRTLKQKAMEYEKHPTEYNLTDLAHSYAELLEAQLGDTVQPGCFAEYGVALAMLGKHSEANRMFNNEVLLYPNAQRYVRQLKLQLVPEYIADTVSDTSTLYIIEVEDTVAATLPATMSAKDSVQQAKALQRKLREEEKRRQAEAKQANAEERELVKSIREKEKAERDRQRAEAKEAKEQAKKAAAQQKKEAAKQKERDKKEAEKAKAAEREEQQRERAQAREQRAREKAEAREQQKKNQQERDQE